MNFSQTIKSIRQKENLTQDQFAQKLSVTRQAVSNWENDKNLPDIEMIIQISEVFHVSLDLLLKGEEDNMNNMTQKVIEDGKENKKAKYNMVTSCIGLVFFLLGILLLAIKANSVEYIDEFGILHENFYLLPLGFLSIFIALLLFLSVGLHTLIQYFKKKNNNS